MPAVESRRAAAAADCDKCDKDMCKICFMCLIIAFYGPWGRTHTHTHLPPLAPPHLSKGAKQIPNCRNARNVVEFQVCFKYLRNAKKYAENVFNYI